MFNRLLFEKRIGLSSSYFSNLSQKSLLKHSFSNPSSGSIKPTNVLIYSPGSCQHISKVVQAVQNSLAPNCYTCYSVFTSALLKEPWTESTKAVIILNTLAHLSPSDISNVKALLNNFILHGGKLLNFSVDVFNKPFLKQSTCFKNYSGQLNIIFDKSNERKSSRSITVLNNWPGFVIETTLNKRKLISLEDNESSCVSSYCDDNENHVFTVLPILDVDCNKEISLQNEYILSYLLFCLGLETKWDSLEINSSIQFSNDKVVLMFSTANSIQLDFFQKIFNTISLKSPICASGLKFVSSSHLSTNPIENVENEISIIFSDNSDDLVIYKHKFDWETYKINLFSQRYGKIVFYADVLPTTMTVLDGICTKLPLNFGPIVIAKQQLKGEGRGGNKWLSPVGCAMFTIVVHVPLSSHLGVALPFLQHLTSVAAVHAIRTMPGLKDIQLNVKWPNDIYYGSSIKLGGVLVKSTVVNGVCIASIGCGINIANNKPTICVNHLLKENYDIQLELKCEEVIARTVSYLEEFIENFQQRGPESFVELYYRYWIHSNAEVDIMSDNESVPCTIIGVDEYGYLRARRHSDGVVISLHPDGNSFDIMKNLIVAKKSPDK